MYHAGVVRSDSGSEEDGRSFRQKNDTHCDGFHRAVEAFRFHQTAVSSRPISIKHYRNIAVHDVHVGLKPL